MENDNMNDGITLSEIFHVLKKNILIILGTFLIVMIIGGIYLFGISKPKYKSSCMIMVQFDNSTSTTSDVVNSLRIVGTVAEFIENDIVAEKTADILDGKVSVSDVKSGLSASYGDTSLNITVSYTTTNKEVAKEVVDTAILVAADIANNTVSENGTDPYYPAIKNAISKVGSATDPVVVSMSKKVVLIIVALIGVFLGVLIAVLKEVLNNTCTNSEEIEERYNIQVIGMIPDFVIDSKGRCK